MCRTKNAVQRLCSYPGCGRKHFAKDLCRSHYLIVHSYKQAIRPLYTKDNPKSDHKCKIEGCTKRRYSSGYCQMHNYRFKKNGDPFIVHTRGVKGNGGHQDYPNHSLFKRNRLIVLKENPLCSGCGDKTNRLAQHVHHIDGSRDNHEISNLLPVCVRCHFSIHRNLMTKSFVLNDLKGMNCNIIP